SIVTVERVVPELRVEPRRLSGERIFAAARLAAAIVVFPPRVVGDSGDGVLRAEIERCFDLEAERQERDVGADDGALEWAAARRCPGRSFKRDSVADDD